MHRYSLRLSDWHPPSGVRMQALKARLRRAQRAARMAALAVHPPSMASGERSEDPPGTTHEENAEGGS